MNVRLTLVTTAAAVLTVASIAVAQVPTPSVSVAPAIASTAPVAPVVPQIATTPWPTAEVVSVIASADQLAPAAAVSPALSPSALVAPVAPVAAVAPVASVSPVAVPEAPQVPSAQSPRIVATTPQPRLKVVRPATGDTPKVTLTTAGEDPQAPPTPQAPPAPPVPPQAPSVFGGVRGGARAPEGVTPIQAPRFVRGQLINLRLEFTITDQIGSATPVKKTVTMSVADGESGRIRTNADVYRKAGNSGSFTSVPLSIDATPAVEGTKIRLKASLEYQLLNDAASADVPGGKTSITQAVTSILGDGVSAVLCQSADPLTDRKVTLEVKATIVK